MCEATSAGSGTDSERYLAAGAVRSFYISTPVGGIETAMAQVMKILAEAENAVVESTSALEFLRPELALVVIDAGAGEVKDSLRRWTERFDAIVTTRSAPLDGALKQLAMKPRFEVHPPQYCSEELTAYVKKAMGK